MSNKNEIAQLEEKRENLKVTYKLEMEQFTKQLFALQMKDFIEKNKHVFEENGQEIPVKVRLSYYSEYNDEGGTEPYLEDVELYDQKDEMVNTDLLVYEKVSYREEPIETTLKEKLHEFLYEHFETEDLENYLGEEIIRF